MNDDIPRISPICQRVSNALTANAAFILESIEYPTMRREHTSLNAHVKATLARPMLRDVHEPLLIETLGGEVS